MTIKEEIGSMIHDIVINRDFDSAERQLHSILAQKASAVLNDIKANVGDQMYNNEE